MSLAEAADFLEESRTLAALLEPQDEAAFARATQFKGWTINDVLVHLHFWNKAVDLAASDEAAFKALLDPLMAALTKGGLRAYENATIPERGRALFTLWKETAEDIAARWAAIDPKQRIPWVGPSMSARSAITARQMETWAHGFEIFDVLGAERPESDRIRNLVVLGINTFGWSHQVNRLPVPEIMPELKLTAPSGEVWTFGDAQAGRISGPATDFAAVVTQTRAVADTALVIEGAVARTWMDHAQCFAGPPEKPPVAGSRHRAAKV
ncbi:TIGR03084 family metal-binding protein [Rhizobium sp. C4]|uniref:TIGR03084 family metal-binding protein n=1 Tax=Rhizobium sp. C4 TaxID=1349800 RepID=UPI001E4F2701|nr:TIGR03084 family metal-binding protein [Rhizobium sp. C4]MCD2174857.1 TIGR03084 family metal-binding protein [Rhizobium sp. C4]